MRAKLRLVGAALLCIGAGGTSQAQPLAFGAREATWTALDVAPDGRTLLFDLLGDIYALDAQRGGRARPVLQGPAFETHPVYSPDGRRFAFLSDRSGGNNLWVANADGSDPRQLSFDSGATLFASPAWSADGRFVYVSRTLHSILAFELFMYDTAGGTGVRVTSADASGHTPFDDRHNALGAVASRDGRYLYYATKSGSIWSQKELPHWSIARRDLRRGVEDIIIAAHGGAMRPALSPDGRWLAYGSRQGAHTGIRLRDLETGADRALVHSVDPDGQLGGYYADLLPRFVFSPDGRTLIYSAGGGIHRVDIASGARADIPFEAPVQLAIGASTRVQQTEETGPVRIRVIQSPRQSPDGKAIAFAALGGVYAQALAPGAVPVRLSGATLRAYQPAWSPDGRSLAFVTWTAADGGHVWTVSSKGGKPRQLTRDAAFYSEPVYSPDGHSIVVLRSSHYDRTRAFFEIAFGGVAPDRVSDIVRLPVSGGAPQTITSATAVRGIAFGLEPDRVRYYGAQGVHSVRLDGTDPRLLMAVVARSPSKYIGSPGPAAEVRLSPKGDWALVRAASQLHLVAVPPANGAEAPVVDLAQPSVSARRLTRIGADYCDWADDGRSIVWSAGATFHRITLDAALRVAPGEAELQAQTFGAPIELPRDVPQGALLLHGGTAITMRGDEVIENADVLVVGNRITAIGAAGSLTIPAGTSVRDVSGHFLLPGFIDTHAHWVSIKREVLDFQHWSFLANLAYGVTSGLDVQPFTVDAFAYQDAIDAGLMLGPRAWSTGPGVFVNSEIDSKEAAVGVLKRYRDHYRTRNIKAYMVGGRQQRQYLVEAARELGMMPTTEGASDLWLNLTHAIDGFAGNEHSLPVSPLRDDVIRLYAQTRIGYTPTLSVLYGGWIALDDMIIRDGLKDPKFARFTPPDLIAERLTNRRWHPPELQTYASFARDALRIQRAGGLVGMGSHGEVQGLGYHWEMQVYASGGAQPLEVLRAATIGSAEIIGRVQEIGSLEAGKFADLLLLDQDPRVDIRNTQSIREVMKNGRLYEADTLEEVWPRKKALGALWFQEAATPPSPAAP